ncbi:MAG: SUMF1/EgtB/PvdO family nonheme iron enzyme [Candidatus Cloacimonadaceae bacterium]
MKPWLAIIMLAAATLCAAQSAPVVYNVSASQRTDGSKLVDIHYDLFENENELCLVELFVSDNNGHSFDIRPAAALLSGDVGESIVPGAGKHIVWDISSEELSLDGDFYRFKVTAHDSCPFTIPPNFVFVPGGTFNWNNSNVTISSFWMDKYEITQSEYQRIMKKNPAYGYGEGADYPVYRVSWFNCVEYCNRRSLREGLEPAYSFGDFGANPDYWPVDWDENYFNHSQIDCDWSSGGYRLPSYMEWVFTARGGIFSHGYAYSGSNDLDLVAWYTANSDNHSHRVGTKPANELGVHDLTGNVWEWVWDIWDTSWSPGNTTDPHGPLYGIHRVTSGGGYSTAAQYCPISWYNCGYHADSIYWSTGFRICKNANYQPPDNKAGQSQPLKKAEIH